MGHKDPVCDHNNEPRGHLGMEDGSAEEQKPAMRTPCSYSMRRRASITGRKHEHDHATSPFVQRDIVVKTAALRRGRDYKGMGTDILEVRYPSRCHCRWCQKCYMCGRGHNASKAEQHSCPKCGKLVNNGHAKDGCRCSYLLAPENTMTTAG